jgi:hypothetical protein
MEDRVNLLEMINLYCNFSVRIFCLNKIYLTKELVRYTHFLKKIDQIDELGCLDKVESGLSVVDRPLQVSQLVIDMARTIDKAIKLFTTKMIQMPSS